ncbi:hypothetical protein [Novosphingopyxis sp. YJ-S2-01]|uniref:hypothetical protein n=1 Tax=Novosphingopyxis sp. YJ-S2-01 TaxID=2794021 RepID=UPI0018DCDEB7|nr:hypothetical protein [Novosphingopyxis sp. YJ-S2-01]MBH9537525.1 hypothetical protein [Novosphingopyxis sp. YJ-S2-01]
MEEALIARLRASTAIAEIAGTFKSRPAIDLHERKSNEKTAFPAVVVTINSPGKTYSQAGPDPVQQRLVRFESFGLSVGSAILLDRAVIAELEQAKLVQGVQFSRAQLRFQRDFDPEDLGNLRIFRRLSDLVIPTNR